MDVANPVQSLVLGSSPSSPFPSSSTATTPVFTNDHGITLSNNPGGSNVSLTLANISYPITTTTATTPNDATSNPASVIDEAELQKHKLELLERQKQHHLRQFLYYRQLAEQEEKENQRQLIAQQQQQQQQQESTSSFPVDQADLSQGLGKTSAWIASLAQVEQEQKSLERQQQQQGQQAVDPTSAYVFHPADSPGSQVDLSVSAAPRSNSNELVEDTITGLIAYESDSPIFPHVNDGINAGQVIDETAAFIDDSIAELLHSSTNSTSRSSVSSSNGTIIHTPSPPSSIAHGASSGRHVDHATDKPVEWDPSAFSLDLEHTFEPALFSHQNSYQAPVLGNNVFRSTAVKRDWTDITSYASMYEDQDRVGLQRQQQQHQQQVQESQMLTQKRQMMGQDSQYHVQAQHHQMMGYGARSSIDGVGLQVQPDVRAMNVNAAGYTNQQMMVGADNGIVGASQFAHTFPASAQGRMMMMDATPRYGMYAGDGQYSGHLNNNASSTGMNLYTGGSGLDPNHVQQQEALQGRTNGSFYYDTAAGGYDSFQPTFNGRVLPAYASMGAVVQTSSPTMPHQQQQHQQQQGQQRQEQNRASIGLQSPESRMNQSPLSDYHRNMASQNADNINHLLMGGMNGSAEESSTGVKREHISPHLQKSHTDEVDQIVDDDQDDRVDDFDDHRSIGSSLVDELDAEVEAALGGSSSRRPSQLRKPGKVATKSKSHRKAPYANDQAERVKRRNKSVSAAASNSSRGSGDLSNGSDLVLSERAVISRNILYEDGKPKIRNPLGGGRGYVPGETPDDPSKKHKCEVCGRGFARLFNLKVSWFP